MLFKCFTFLSVVLLTSANVIPEGSRCRSDIEVVQDFDLEKYMGHWYEVQVYETPMTKASECPSANYTKTGERSFSAEHSSLRDGERRSHSATGVLVEPPTGKIALAYHPKVPQTEANYYILDTDYENFAIVWSCRKSRDSNAWQDMAWILSRTAELNSDVEGRVDAIVEKYLDKEKLISKTGEGCST